MNTERLRLGNICGGTKSEKRKPSIGRGATLDIFEPDLPFAIFSTIPTGRLVPNIEPYLQYISKRIHEWDLVYKESWINMPPVTSTAQQSTSHIVAKVLSIFQGLEITDPTIDDVVTKLCSEYKLDQAIANAYQPTLRHLVFAALGWATMLYNPIPNGANQHFCINSPNFAGRDSSSQRCQNMTISSRPVAAMLRGFGIGNANRRTTSDSSLPTNPEESSGRVQTSNLHYDCLWYLCGVSIRWIDNLDNHLCFDPTTRVLMLFRFPSFCLVQLQNSNEIILERFLRSINNADAPNITGTQSYLREVLLSYRLIFGNDSKSRKLFRKKERPGIQQAGFYDQSLNDLCGRDMMRSPARHDISLFVDSVYNAAFDFPHLGMRLLKLHSYSVSQNPSKLKELWDDRRNPLQWFTFWAVICFGGISIILSLIQTGLSIGQLYASLER